MASSKACGAASAGCPDGDRCDGVYGKRREIIGSAPRAPRRITAEEAFEASRVEMEHQIDEWGLVEGNHDVDRANLRAQLSAASTLQATHAHA